MISRRSASILAARSSPRRRGGRRRTPRALADLGEDLTALGGEAQIFGPTVLIVGRAGQKALRPPTPATARLTFVLSIWLIRQMSRAVIAPKRPKVKE